MRQKLTLAAFGVATLTGFTPALANDNAGFWYVEGGYHYAAFNDDDVDSPTLGLVGGNVGYEFANGWGVEGVVAQGVVDDEVVISGFDVTIEAKTWWGAAVKYQHHFDNAATVYAKLRYTSIELEASALGASADASEWRAGYAIGGTMAMTESSYVVAELNQFTDKNIGFFVGLGARF